MNFFDSLPAPGTRTLVYGHRGAMAYAPQNTMESFAKAWELGADGVELDVQLTRDRGLVVFHDDDLDDLTDGRGPVYEMDSEALLRLDAGTHFGAAWKNSRIPSLETVLSSFPEGKVLNIELKTDIPHVEGLRIFRNVVAQRRHFRVGSDLDRDKRSRELCEVFAAYLESSIKRFPSLVQRVIVSSFDPLAISTFAALMPRVPVGFLYSPSVAHDTRPAMKTIPYRAWHPHYRMLSAAEVRRRHEDGLWVNTWTVNDADAAKRLRDWGVDGIITNVPDTIRSALA